MQSPALAPAFTLAIGLVTLAAFGCAAGGDQPSDGAFTHIGAMPRWQPSRAGGAAPSAAGENVGGAGGTDAGAASDSAGGAGGAAGATSSQACPSGQMILTGDVVNARDLGGVALRDGRHVTCGAIFRGSPLRLSAEGCEELARLDMKSVIDLRTASERASTPDVDCGTTQSVLAPLPIPYGLSAEDYLRDLHETASLAVAFRSFGSADAYPIYFHCTFGRDRTGVVAALVLLALGATRETVMQEYLLSKPFVGAYPDALAAVWDVIEARGGADAVLEEAGITEAELATLRERAISD